MRNLPAETISNFVGEHRNSGASPILAFIPVVDNKLVFADYTARALAGEFSKKASSAYCHEQRKELKYSSQPSLVPQPKKETQLYIGIPKPSTPPPQTA